MMPANCTRSEPDTKGGMGKLLKSGAPGEIRTPDLQLRRLPLYPAELRARRVPLTQVYRDNFSPSIVSADRSRLGRQQSDVLNIPDHSG